MFPQFRMDGPQMSPMTLEMLARGEGMDQNSSEVCVTLFSDGWFRHDKLLALARRTKLMEAVQPPSPALARSA